jgi:ADP-ribose pyrophosphatase YjhB (NUDIX family)
MLIAPNGDLSAHAVTVNPPTAENPRGYHRLIGGSVELGESHRTAIIREVDEELGAAIQDLAFLSTVENIFEIDGVTGHEIVFVYSGRLDPQPPLQNAVLTERDGTVVPIAWRSFLDADESLPLYPGEVAPWVQRVAQSR